MADELFLERLKLPEPRHDSNVSIERALCGRRSVRSYRDEPLTLAEVSQILWAAQGVTNPRGFRSAPSAGALYPLEVYLIAGKVKDLAPGIYKYKMREHVLVKTNEGDKRGDLCRGALRQGCIREAPVVLIFCAVYERITRRYGERGIRYVFMEVGHAAQNVHLQAVSMDLGTVVIGAFQDNDVKNVIGMPDEERPLYIMPVGKMR